MDLGENTRHIPGGVQARCHGAVATGPAAGLARLFYHGWTVRVLIPIENALGVLGCGEENNWGGEEKKWCGEEKKW